MTREMLLSFTFSDTMKSMGERAIGERLSRMRASALCAGEAFRNMATIAPDLRDLAMHVRDEPAETLLRLAPQQGVHLVMPQLGQAVEPAQVDSVTLWWRGVEQPGAAVPEPTTWPKSLDWPAD